MSVTVQGSTCWLLHAELGSWPPLAFVHSCCWNNVGKLFSVVPDMCQDTGVFGCPFRCLNCLLVCLRNSNISCYLFAIRSWDNIVKLGWSQPWGWEIIPCHILLPSFVNFSNHQQKLHVVCLVLYICFCQFFVVLCIERKKKPFPSLEKEDIQDI